MSRQEQPEDVCAIGQFRPWKGRLRARENGVQSCCKPLCSATLFGVLIVLGWIQSCPPVMGQVELSVAKPGPVDAPSQSKGEGAAAVPPVAPAWGPSLDWSPHKPGLQVERDGFVNAEVPLVFPRLTSFLTAPVVMRDGTIRTVALGNASLNASVSPSIQVGALRFGPGYGELAFTYRSLATDGSSPGATFDPAGEGVIRSRLNLQSFSLDYIRRDCPLGWDTVLSWEVGVRAQVVFFDTQAQTADSFQQARNYFFGAGPHAALGLTKSLSNGFELFGRLDGGVVLGYNTAQNFVLATIDPVAGTSSALGNQQQTQFSPMFAIQVGMAWTPLSLPSLHLRAGYQFEQWYNLGQVVNSHGDLNAHGLFVGCAWSF
jgi:hypothetical protein